MLTKFFFNISKYLLIALLVVGVDNALLYAQQNDNQTNDTEEKEKLAPSKSDLRRIRNQKIYDSIIRLIYIEGKLEYKYQFLFGGGLCTDGYKSYMELGLRTKMKSLGTLLFHADLISERQSPRQYKISSLYQLQSGERTIYIYRKQNIFHLMNILVGQQYQIGNLYFKKAVSINGFYKMGLSLALLRPYYLKVLSSDPATNSVAIKSIKYTPETAESFLNQTLIVTSGGIGFGWDEIETVPGFHFETGLRFYFLPKLNWRFLIGMECSAGMDIYNKDIAILIPDAATPANNFYFNGNVAFLIGWRK